MATLRANLDTTVSLLKEQEGSPRRFRLRAYTGAEFTRWYGKAILDVQGLKVPDRSPILIDHKSDLDYVAGFADKATKSVDEGLILEGPFTNTNDRAKTLAALSDEGYPLTASVGVNVLKVEELAEGQTARVNGREVKGPCAIWRESQLFECSFVTSNPADKATTAAALNHQEQAMTPDEFLKAHPEAVKAWKEEAAKAQALADKTRLADLLTAMPAGREAFVMEQYAKGADLLTAKAALADVLIAEAAERAKAPKAEAPKDPLLEALKAKAEHPGLGFNGNARQDGSPEERMRAEAASAGVDPEALAAFERATKKGYVRVGVVDRAAAAIGRGE